MQTILGSGGAIGIALAKALPGYTSKIRLVSRQPQKVNATDEVFPADLLQPQELKKAIAGSEVVYVTVGFPYRYKSWAWMWPKFVETLLNLCEPEGCKLVFFDNIYLYDKNTLNRITEKSAINPPSKKGKIRAAIAQKILDTVEKGSVKALIARSADFYGPSIAKNCLLTETLFNPLSQGKTANWLVNDNHKHSFTYTPDAGKATALLGNTEEAYGQVWHLPTCSNPLTGKEWVQAVAAGFNKKPKYRVVSKRMIRLMGLFMSVMRESYEMLYQYDRDYVFDSSKFEKAFDFQPTSYDVGIREIINTDYSHGINT